MRWIYVSIIAVALLVGYADGVDGQPDAASESAIPSTGCGVSEAEAGYQRGVVELEDGEHHWHAWVPDTHDGLTPVPLWIHLNGVSGSAAADASLIAPEITARGYALLAPQGTFGDAGWMFAEEDVVVDLSSDNPGIVLIDALIDQVGEELCLDLARLYAAGHGAGAGGVSVLACVLEERLAAVAANAGVWDLGDACQPTRAVPIIAVHGTRDWNVRFDGGYGKPGWDAIPILESMGRSSIAHRLARIARRRGCHPEPTTETIADTAERRMWACPAKGELELVVHQGDHGWYLATPGLDLTEMVWRFFERHPLPE